MSIRGSKALHSVSRALAILVLAGGIPPGAIAAPITFNTALPVSQGEGLMRVQVKHLRATDDPGPAGRELTVTAVPVVGAWGVTSRWTPFSVVPWRDRRRTWRRCCNMSRGA